MWTVTFTVGNLFPDKSFSPPSLEIFLQEEDMMLVGSLWILWILVMCRAAAGTEPISDPSLRPGQGTTEGQSQAASQGQYKCLELSNKDHHENRTGSPAFLRDAAGELSTEATGVNAGKSSVADKLILENEKKCLEKMKQDPPHDKSGPYCGRTWDGWLCWDDTPAGTYSSQNCPNYFLEFDPTGLHCSRNWDGLLCWDDTPAGTHASQNCPDYISDMDPTEQATKYCGEDGQWFRLPESNKTWTNYTLCAINFKEKAAAQLSGDAEIQAVDEATVSPR
ncbi:hypothetical protein INR49_023604 [Caranx melampygus]|nr:hypothetical protein INR49_023604 [Caranx melampygus]